MVSSTAASGRFVLANVAPTTLSRLRGSEPAPVEGSQLKINMVLRRLPACALALIPGSRSLALSTSPRAYEQLEAAFRAVDAGSFADPQPSEIYCHT